MYEEIWQDMVPDTHHDGTRERLIRQAWNLKKVPMFAKKEIVRMLEGERIGIRNDVIQAMRTYSKEIEKNWPRDLRLAVYKAVKEIEAESAS